MLRNSQATGVVLGAAILALPLLAALIRFFNLPEKDKLRSRPWVQYCQLHRVLRLVVVIAWCALYEWSPMLESVFWGLPTIATFVGTAEVVLMTRSVLELKWTQFDLFRLAVWGTASLAVPLLMTARGFHDALNHKLSGCAWLIAAGVAAIVGTVRLRAAQGFKLRKVKSGTVLNRTRHLARRVGVRVENVYVVPSGRGELTNAFASAHSVSLTDNFGEYLKGPELDAVIAHELGHIQGRHTRKKFAAVAGIGLGLSAFALAIPPESLGMRACFMLSAILVLLLSYYSISRRFEYECDVKAVRFTQSPEATIRALVALYEKTNAPIHYSKIIELFMTHPSLIKRVQAIGRLSNMGPARLAEFLPENTEALSTETAAP
jgi:Zn-dependent protease with chaperone function